MTKSKSSAGNWPIKLSAPARRALDNAGYRNLEQLTELTEADLKKLHGMGPKGIEMLRQALSERGLSFAQIKT